MTEPQQLISIKAALQEKRMPLYRSVIRWTWRLLIGGLVAVTVLFLSINFTAIPSFRELEDPSSALASEVLANNNEVLGRYFTENRVPVAYENLSPHLVNALIATEDERFREHCGIDARAVGRVLFRTILLRDQSAGGGSTLTQQLAKMLYSDRNFQGMSKVEKFFALVYRKLREWITAVKLERSYTKEEILAMYLNQFNFINNAYGIHAASEVYFGKDQSQLKIEEAAMLIGMLQNPSYFNPVRFPERAMKRRWIVLYQMRNNAMITEAQFDELKVKPLDMSHFKRVTFTDDKAPYLCSELKKDITKILDAPECRRSDGSKYNIYKDGLKIYTTIDPAYQQHAEEAMQEHMKKLQSRFFQVWKGRDPWTYRTRNTGADEIEGRKAALMSLVRDGDRYQAIRPKYLDAVSDRVQKRYDFELRDADIERMLDEERKPGSFGKLIADGIATPDQVSTYRSVMRGVEWAEIKNQYRALQVAIKKVYDTKTRMKVFSWNTPNFEKDTVMSPLDSLRYHRMFLQCGLLAMDPTTSEIRAWVGGINFKYFQFDHIRTDRQVGSTFKPFVYGAAFDQGLLPTDTLMDTAVEIPLGNRQVWRPTDGNKPPSDMPMTLSDGLAFSKNTITAQVMQQVGPMRVAQLARAMGVRESKLDVVPSLALGTSPVTLKEMVAAYGAIASAGSYRAPRVITRIEDKNGKVLEDFAPTAPERVLGLAAAQQLRDAMRGVVDKGTGVAIRSRWGISADVAGKTGTTQDNTDGWFILAHPQLVAGARVGFNDNSATMGSWGQGARSALPMVGEVFQYALRHKRIDAQAEFDIPRPKPKPAPPPVTDPSGENLLRDILNKVIEEVWKEIR